MLSNAYFLAKFRFDTAENEPAKNFQNFANFEIFPILLTNFKNWDVVDEDGAVVEADGEHGRLARVPVQAADARVRRVPRVS